MSDPVTGWTMEELRKERDEVLRTIAVYSEVRDITRLSAGNRYLDILNAELLRRTS